MKQPIRKRIKASGTVEILLAISLFMMLGTFIVGALVYSLSSMKLPNVKKNALEYASEGLEIVRYIRKGSISNIADGTYGVAKSGSEWVLTAAPENITTGFTRSITISTRGAGEKLVIANVNWSEGGTSGTESIATILTNWQETIVSNPWELPQFRNYYQLASTTYDVYGLHIVGNSLYALLQNNNSNTYLTTYNISDPSNFVQQQQLSVVGDNTTDYVYTGSRLYLSTVDNGTELVGVNTPTVATNSVYANYNLSGNQDATGIDVVGNLIYITRASNAIEFSIIRDNGNGSYTPRGTYNSSNTLSDVAVRNNYAYVSHNAAASDLLVLNVTNDAPILAATVNTSSSAGTARLAFWNQYLLMFTNDVGLLIYDCTNPVAPVFRGSYDTAGAINDFAFDQSRNLLFLATDNNARELQIIDLSNMTNPVLRGYYDASIPTLSVAFDAVNDRVYLGSSDNTNEFIVIDAK